MELPSELNSLYRGGEPMADTESIDVGEQCRYRNVDSNGEMFLVVN